MLRPAARLALAAAVPSSARTWRVRYISTPAVVTLGHHARALDRNIYLFHRELLNHTNDPFWILQSRLRSPHKLLTHRNAARFLSPTGMGPDEFKERWSPLLYSASIEAAIGMLRKADFNIPTLLPSNEDSSAMAVANPVPSWLTFFLASHKVRTPEHAAGPLMQLVYSQLPATATHYQPHLLVFAALALSSFGVRMHVADIIRRFLLMPMMDPRLLFNHLLIALARQDGSKELASSVVDILQAMRSRQITLTPYTYQLLLADRFVTTELTKVLRAQMLHEGFVSDQKHLEAYLRIYAEGGAIHNMKQYRTAIRAQALRRGGCNSGQPQDVMIADSQALSALSIKDRGSAFQFLAHLVESNTPTPANSTKADSSPSTPAASHSPQRLPNRTRLRPIRRSITSRSHKTTIPDIYEWTSVLAAASRDMSTSSEQLIKLLQHILDTHKLVPTVATYTVVLRGLIYRRDLELALEVWKIFRASGLKLDDRALVVGLQVLTRAGKPHLAFELLERYAAWPQLSSDTTVQTTTSDAEASKTKPQRKVILSTIGMNEFMVSLQRIGRPDLVFFLWDHMYTLYGITPNVATLSILLKSAHLAAKLDDSLQGMWNSFRQRKVDASTPPRSRNDITNMLKDLVGNVDIGLMPYSSGRWRGRSAWVHAADIFKRVVFHAKPELRHTNPSQLPAHALRLSSDQLATSPFATLLRASLASIVPGISSFTDTTTGFTTTTTDATTDTVHGFPILPTHALANMTPTEPCFKQFLQLVAIHDTPAHIPTILSWMRALDVRPTRTTIALVVILWGEVASHAPIVEHYYSARKERDAIDAAGANSSSSSAFTESPSSTSSPSPADERSQFFRLQAWLKKWLGESFPAPSKTQYHQAFKLICGLRSPVSRASGEVMDPRKNKFLTEEKLVMFRRLRFATAKRKRRARKRVMRTARITKNEGGWVRGDRRVSNGKSGKIVKAMVGMKKPRVAKEGDTASALGSSTIDLDHDTP